MVVFKDLPPSRLNAIMDRAFRIENNFFDAGKGCILPKRYADISEKVKNLKIRSDDVFICSFPRTGSTWLTEVLWLLAHDLDYEGAGKVVQQVRNPTLELSTLFSDDKDKTEWIK